MKRLRSLAAFSAIALLSSACVLRFGPIEDDDWEETTGDTTTVGVGGSGGGTSDGGSGNVGGSSSGGGDVGGSTSGSGGSGGDPYCEDGSGYGDTVDVCESLAVHPDTAGMCGEWQPLGYLACLRSFEIYETGHAENFAGCLGGIPAADACVDAPVGTCLGAMYQDACPSSYISDVCDSFADVCTANGESFDVEECRGALNPFSDDGLYELIDCMNVTEGSCQGRYDGCFDAVITL